MPERVVFRASTGADYEVAASWLGRDRDGRLRVVMGAADVTALDRDALFHLVDAARPAAMTLNPSVPVTLDLRPSPELLADVEPSSGPDVSAGVAAWLGSDARRRRCDAWFAARIAQPDAAPPLNARTLWDYLDLPPGTAGADLDAAEASRAALAFLRAEHPDLGQADGMERLLDLLAAPASARPADALSQLAAVLTDAGSEPVLLEDGSGLRFAMQGQSGSWPCLVQASARGALIFYCIYPHVVAPDRLVEAYDRLGRWNSDQLVGTLDLDPGSGRVVLRTPLLLDTRTPSVTLLRRVLDEALDTMDEALPLLAELTGPAGAAEE